MKSEQPAHQERHATSTLQRCVVILETALAFTQSDLTVTRAIANAIAGEDVGIGSESYRYYADFRDAWAEGVRELELIQPERRRARLAPPVIQANGYLISQSSDRLWRETADRLQPLVQGLVGAADAVSHAGGEVALTDDDVQELLTAVDLLEGACRDLPGDDPLRAELITTVARLRALLRRYRVLGPGALREAARVAVAEAALMPRDHDNRPARPAAFAALKRVAQVSLDVSSAIVNARELAPLVPRAIQAGLEAARLLIPGQ